jgi:hypothetical protein
MKYRYVLQFDTDREIPPADLANLQAHLEAQLETLSDADTSQDYRGVTSSMTTHWTFEEFVASREHREDIGAAVGGELYDERCQPCVKPGYLYLGQYFMEIEADGTYCVTYGNQSAMFSDLSEAERALFDCAFHDGI